MRRRYVKCRPEKNKAAPEDVLRCGFLCCVHGSIPWYCLP